MKNLKALTLIAAGISFLSITNQVSASEADCAIWLCLPAGFAPEGCGEAKSAFRDRITHFKPPLPRLSSCMVSPDKNETGVDSSEGMGAWIPPSTIVKGVKCNVAPGFNGTRPRGCVKTIRWVSVSVDGQPNGEPYYFDNKGNKIEIDTVEHFSGY